MIYRIKFTLDEIEDVAKSIINEINDVNLVLFKGELGSGKTTLIKSILKNLGVKENITSPTFSIVNQYHISNRLIKEGLNYDNKLEISSSWFTKTNKGEQSPMHDHKNCVFSAVYYYGDYDDQVGNLLEHLKNLGLEEDTIIVFTSDNGPYWKQPYIDEFHHRAAGELRGMKGDIYAVSYTHLTLPTNREV